MQDCTEQYKETVEKILAIPRYRKKMDQNGIAQLLEMLGNPQEDFAIIHVAGTNGKGSICAYLNEIGQKLGFRMGLFTSPHLIDIRERFRIDHTMIPQKEFTVIYEKVKQAEQKMQEMGAAPATFFEMIFAMACCWFSRQKVDYAIIEAGMGGRSDTTNVVHPCLSVIASIGLDHTAILGDTLEKIAYEKAGILKKDVPAVISEVPDRLASIIAEYGKKVGAKCHFMKECDVKILKNTPEGIDFSMASRYDKKGLFHTGMCGIYQVQNASVAIYAAQLLWQADTHSIADAVARTKWPARMQEAGHHFYVDGAHNDQAVKCFVQTVQNSFLPDSEKILLYAAAADKDLKRMAADLMQIPFSHVIVTELANERKSDGKTVVSLLEKEAQKQQHTPEILLLPQIQDAVQYARKIQKKDAYVFCVGSLYLAGDILAEMQKGKNDNTEPLFGYHIQA